VGILAKVLFFGFVAFWALGILLYVMAPMLWRFIHSRLTNYDQRNSPARQRLPGETAKIKRGDPKNERR
jgi:membrane protein insertase Oxa1/YidC/SpoIIIJ